MNRITITVDELRDFMVAQYCSSGHRVLFICDSMRAIIYAKRSTNRYFLPNYEESVLTQLGEFTGVKFENWYNGIDCTMSEGTMYGWYLRGYDYIESVGVTPKRERSSQYFLELDECGLKVGARANPMTLDNLTLSRIGILVEILENRPDAAFVIEVA